MRSSSVLAAADVKLERLESGFTITGIELVTKANVPGGDAAKFQQIAEETKKGCPVSKVLAATKISLNASLT